MKMVLNLKQVVAVIAASLAINVMAQTQVSTVPASETGMSLSKVTGSFLVLGHFNIDDVNTKTGAHTDEYQYRLGYKITPDTSVGVLGTFAYSKVGTISEAAQADVDYYDSALTMTTKTGAILGSDPVVLDFRIYAPTSRSYAYSKPGVGLETREAMFRLDAAMNFPITPKIAAGLLLSPRHTIVKTGPNVSKLVSSANVAYNFTDALSTYAAINDELKIVNDGSQNTTTFNHIGPEVGVNYSATKNLDLSLIMAQERNVLNPTEKEDRSEYSMFYAKETEYQLQGVMHF